jgi:Leucine-rich repeat (LRR) protein
MMNKLILSIGIVLCAVVVQAQLVDIPDANFKKALVANNAINTNMDTEIQLSEAFATDSINVILQNISSLKGIEVFVNLTHLYCSNNQLNTLDLSQNTALTVFFCSSNKLSSLDLSQNTALTDLRCQANQLMHLDLSKNTSLSYLNCGFNQLNNLDLSQNIALKYLQCYSNQLGSLDVSKNTALSALNCSYNPLGSLDLSQNTALRELYCSSSPNLSQICLNNNQLNLTISTPDNWIKDASSNWSTTCATSIEETELLHTNKKLIKILTPLGQELQPEQATEGLLIYQYSDGSTRKVMKQ